MERPRSFGWTRRRLGHHCFIFAKRYRYLGWPEGQPLRLRDGKGGGEAADPAK